MPYSITYKPSAAKALRKVHPTERRRIARAIGDLAVTPRPPGAIQLAGGEGELRIRVGNYRIIYDIEDDALVVLVLRIGHRGDVLQVPALHPPRRAASPPPSRRMGYGGALPASATAEEPPMFARCR
ncbi:type II toxin-antitoxin system RelE family toxin [Dietzia psychralcaliphila]|uniref:type II toxin-antitoxin system RelE family toxin n=1 Tax=Dietzia psychralcaliphila TaxID=139021 RepID=UPI001C1E2548|nr:type II toxin-antitoxin system RelE/ParE family toxin [Dietzia psychralcaliphila]